ncbi:hypothetical protein VTJ04DRAFT_3793 [Mycothermus thermophilus]|uniref:uncharacterized protein n=1 Tax=Humicola insolens TaxID=85995 RepID=UPI003743A774
MAQGSWIWRWQARSSTQQLPSMESFRRDEVGPRWGRWSLWIPSRPSRRAAVQVQSSAVNRGAPTWDWWNLTEHEKASRRIATEESHPSHFCLITMSLTLLFGDGDVHLNLLPKIAVSRRQPRAPFIRFVG